MASDWKWTKEDWGTAAIAGGTLLDMWGQSVSVAAEIDQIVGQAEIASDEARALADDAGALELSLTDQINEMERQLYRNIGTATATVGASGVAMRGSPMDALIQMHGIAQQDMNAAMRQRDVEVNRKYLESIRKVKGARSALRSARHLTRESDIAKVATVLGGAYQIGDKRGWFS